MLVTQGLTIVAAHVKQPPRHLMNIRRNKITGALFASANDMSTGLQLTIKKNPNTTRYPNK